MGIEPSTFVINYELDEKFRSARMLRSSNEISRVGLFFAEFACLFLLQRNGVGENRNVKRCWRL